MNLLEGQRFNHQPAVFPGLLAEESGGILTNFFRNIRAQGRQAVLDRSELDRMENPN